MKSPLWAKLLIAFGAVILVISLGAFATMSLVLRKIDSSIPQTDLLPPDAAVAVDGHAIEGAMNILLLGTDERPGLGGNRADSIIILHVTANHDGVYLLSIPRDTLATIPAYAKTNYKGGREKINAAFEYGSRNGVGRAGGFELLASTVSNLTGIKFNGAAIVNFAGFTSIVEALGGVRMCVDEETKSWDHDTNGNEWFAPNKRMVYHVGCQDLLPWQALDYVRQREFLPDSDYGRQRHQQQFIKAVAKASLSKGLTDPTKLGTLLDAAGQALTVDLHGVALKDWVFTFKGLPIDKMVMLRTNGGNFVNLQCPDGSSCQQLNAESLKMFEAAKNDTLDGFVTTHPTWIAGDNTIQAPATASGTPTAPTPS
jgi:LCP family protein required for cell wall assembly